MSLTGIDAKAVVGTLEQLAERALTEDHQLSPVEARQRVNIELQYYRDLELDGHSLEQVFQRFCVSLANRAGLFNLVFGGATRFEKQLRAYRRVLREFSPGKVLTKYRGRDGALVEDLLAVRDLDAVSRAHQLKGLRSGFRGYARGLLAGAEHFSRYANGEEFAAFVRKWRGDADLVQMLPLYFEALGVPGFRAALAADFLKELGVKEFGKPDRWVYRIMEHAGWIAPGARELEVQRAFWSAWESLGDEYPPVVLDKLMFLVGAGRFEMVAPAYRCSSRFGDFQRALRRPRAIREARSA
jgi:hypothetical protein